MLAVACYCILLRVICMCQMPADARYMPDARYRYMLDATMPPDSQQER